jgi:TPR repeat protein
MVHACGMELASAKMRKTHFKKAADQGNCEAFIRYGSCLRYGNGVTQNQEEAAKQFKKAAIRGNREGQLRYGICLRDGIAVRQDQQEGAKYMKMSADQGSRPNQ